MPGRQPKDPLHGVTLAQILNTLVAEVGFEALAREVAIRCFDTEPSVGSSLTFLRRTPWARAKVEAIYLRHVAGHPASRSAVPEVAKRPV